MTDAMVYANIARRVFFKTRERSLLLYRLYMIQIRFSLLGMYIIY